MIDPFKLNIKEIAAYLQNYPEAADSLYPILAKDVRSGCAVVSESWL